MYMLGTTLALNRSTAGLRLSKLHLCSVCDVVISIEAKDGGGGEGNGSRERLFSQSHKYLFIIRHVWSVHNMLLQ